MEDKGAQIQNLQRKDLVFTFKHCFTGKELPSHPSSLTHQNNRLFFFFLILK